VQEYAKKPDSRPELAAHWFEQLGELAKAEGLWRRHVERAKDPRAQLTMVAFLRRHGRIAEALDACEKALESCPPQDVVGAILAVVRDARATPEQRARVERWLDAAEKKQPGAALAL